MSRYIFGGSKNLRLVKITDLHFSEATKKDKSVRIRLSSLRARLRDSMARLRDLFEEKTTISSAYIRHLWPWLER